MPTILFLPHLLTYWHLMRQRCEFFWFGVRCSWKIHRPSYFLIHISYSPMLAAMGVYWRSNDEYQWWRHQKEIFSALLAICAGNSQRPVTRSFDVFFDLRLNKRLNKQSWGWWFETLSRPLWRQCNETYAWSINIDQTSWPVAHCRILNDILCA